ncbi:MAG TPA: zf-HC2 domain-containing protein [Gemmatimonadaceae bacterium]|nr:zf-HC2 domain-containing protein [Gemmatimonadaceae bacterium]
MNKCTDSDIQEMLPDLLHRALSDSERRRVEAHVATCESCREDLDVLRTVKSAAIFAPSIDVASVVRQIPPYRTIVPATERPATTRMVSWLVAASLALVALGGGSILLQSNGPTSVRRVIQQSPNQIATTPEPTKPTQAESLVKIVDPVAAPRSHALALAADADGLSDGGLVQLMNDMDNFDALPASEPDPVLSVDSGDSL